MARLDRRNWLFFLTLLCLAVVKFQFMPIRHSLGLQAEMWAEAAIRYFDCAHFRGGFHCYLETDAGYLAFLPRFLAQVIEAFAVIPTAVPIYQQALAFLVILLCCASVTLERFSPIYGAGWSRLLLALVLSNHLDYELHNFINVSYYLVIPAASCLALIAMSDRVTAVFALVTAFIVSLAILSKGVLITLLPMTLLCVGYLVWRRRIGTALALSIPVISAACLQLSTMLHSVQSHAVTVVNADAPLASLIWTAVATMSQGVVVLFTGFGAFDWTRNLVLGFSAASSLVLLILLGATGYHLVFKNRSSSKAINFFVFFGLFFGGALGAHVIAVRGSLGIRVFPFESFETFHLMGRPWFVQATLVVCLTWVFVNEYLQNVGPRLVRLGSLPAVALLFLAFGHPFSYRPDTYKVDPTKYMGFSNWRQFSRYFSDDSVCAPLNPYPWFYGRNCQMLNAPPALGDFASNLSRMSEMHIRVPEDLQRGKLKFLGLYILDRAKGDAFKLEVMSQGEIKEIPSLPFGSSLFVFFPIGDLPALNSKDVELKLRKINHESFVIGVPDPKDMRRSMIWIGAPG